MTTVCDVAKHEMLTLLSTVRIPYFNGAVELNTKPGGEDSEDPFTLSVTDATPFKFWLQKFPRVSQAGWQ